MATPAFVLKGLIRDCSRKRRVKLLSPLLFLATAIHHLPLNQIHSVVVALRSRSEWRKVLST